MPKQELMGITIPNHEKELKECTERLDEIKYNLKVLAVRLEVDDIIHTRMYEEIAAVLNHVGGLSQPLFNVQDEIEEEYKMKYLKTPELGKTLFFKDYGKAHHPYNLIKNRCYRMFTELDEAYWAANENKNPPNWKDSLNLEAAFRIKNVQEEDDSDIV